MLGGATTDSSVRSSSASRKGRVRGAGRTGTLRGFLRRSQGVMSVLLPKQECLCSGGEPVSVIAESVLTGADGPVHVRVLLGLIEDDVRVDRHAGAAGGVG